MFNERDATHSKESGTSLLDGRSEFLKRGLLSEHPFGGDGLASRRRRRRTSEVQVRLDPRFHFTVSPFWSRLHSLISFSEHLSTALPLCVDQFRNLRFDTHLRLGKARLCS